VRCPRGAPPGSILLLHWRNSAIVDLPIVKGQKQSGGKTLGTSGAKMGNVHLKWAFSEAAVLFLCHNAEGEHLLAQTGARYGLFDGEVSPRVAGRRAERRASGPVVSLEPRDRARGDRTDPCATERPEAVDHEPQVRQRDRVMGRWLSSRRFIVFFRDAAPPPSLATTDARRRRRSS
jgi:hypothetical protein